MKSVLALARLTLPALLLAGIATGCAGYRLGSMLPADIRTVYVPTCVNNTSEPLIEQEATRAILSEIQMDGSLKVAPEDLADTVLDITLLRFWIDPVAYVSGDSSTANQYRMSIEASFVLRRRADRSVVADSPKIRGWHDFEFTGDMTSSKAVALRPASQDLGRRILTRIVQYWP